MSSCLGKTHLEPIIKWPGGKEKELPQIAQYAPAGFSRLFDPFVGGGSVFMALQAESYFINDYSEELVSLYQNIKSNNENFFRFAKEIDESWMRIGIFVKDEYPVLEGIYLQYRDSLNKCDLKSRLECYCNDISLKIENVLSESIFYKDLLLKEIKANLSRKFTRMRDLETENGLLSVSDLYDNVEACVKSALYMYYRTIYNRKENKEIHTALFFFLRNYAYSGMFRYNSKGEFNVPYGGIAYNSKTLSKKLNFYRTQDVQKKFILTEIHNKDFEQFLRDSPLQNDDFVFLDPPYDSEFSTYANNEFSKEDQKRLANYLINDCPARWMLIIKHTDFIYELYANKEGVNIRSFDKEYVVSFMNRNNKKVTHLLITNYV
ncbi:MAG: DNA adenine methylase [Paludibacteraceae bacterium]|nr:DNA adenine methylase [Paludibacteraceae bacterium]